VLEQSLLRLGVTGIPDCDKESGMLHVSPIQPQKQRPQHVYQQQRQRSCRVSVACNTLLMKLQSSCCAELCCAVLCCAVLCCAVLCSSVVCCYIPGVAQQLTAVELAEHMLTVDPDTAATEAAKIMDRLNFISTYAFR
jgi:hypothetical protein